MTAFESVRLTLDPHQAVRLAPGLLSRLTEEGLRHRVERHKDGRISVSWDDEAAPVAAVEVVASSASTQIRRRLENLLAERDLKAKLEKQRKRRRRSS